MHAGSNLFRSCILCTRSHNEEQRSCFCNSFQSFKHGYSNNSRLLCLIRDCVFRKVRILLIYTYYNQILENFKIRQNLFIKLGFCCRVIGALAIVIGLYLVLWGKSKDQSPLTCSNDKVAATTSQMAIINGSLESSNQESVAIDVTKLKPTHESV